MCEPVRVSGPVGNPIETLLPPSAYKKVGIYPLKGTIGDVVTVHGCDFTGSEIVTVDGITANIVSYDGKHINFKIPSGVSLLQENDVTVTRNGNPYQAGPLYVSGGIIGSGATVTTNCTGIDVLGLAGCAVENKPNLVDTNPSNSAYIHGSLLNGTSWVDVAYDGPAIPAGGHAGFVIKQGGGLLGANLLGGITITTYLNGQLQETKSGSGVLDLSLLEGTQKQFVNFKTSKPFDEIRIAVTSVNVGLDMHLYGAYGDR